MPQPSFLISTYLISKQVHNHLDKVQLLWSVYNYELEKFNSSTYLRGDDFNCSSILVSCLARLHVL